MVSVTEPDIIQRILRESAPLIIFYPLTGIVTEIEYDVEPEVDLVTITCSNGNMFSWYADAGDYEINDLASCIMDSKGTKYVTDDEVLLAHYAGGLKHFEQYAN